MAIDEATSTIPGFILDCTSKGALKYREQSGSPENLIASLARTGALPKSPNSLSSDLMGMDLSEVPSLSWERLVALHRYRKLAKAFFLRVAEDSEVSAYQALFECSSPWLSIFIGGVVIEKVLRLFFRSFSRLFLMRSRRDPNQYDRFVQNACGEFRPELSAQAGVTLPW